MKRANCTIISGSAIILFLLISCQARDVKNTASTKSGVRSAQDIRVKEEYVIDSLSDNLPALKDKYAELFLTGNVISAGDLDNKRFDVLKKHFNTLTAENAMKPLYLQREKGNFTFEAADKIVDAVVAAGMKMHGHTLAWHNQSGAWMNPAGISRDEAIENLVNHAKTVAAHFKGRVISWDVLNEAVIDNPPNPEDWRASLRQSPWLQAIGPDYVEIVFKAAREADDDALLYYNDYNLDNQSKAQAVYNMVKEINEKNRGADGRPLIDGVGMQGHYRVSTNIDNVEKSLEKFISLGLEVSVTELDIQAGANAALLEAQSLEQGIVYARLFSLFSRHADHIGRVTIWGLDDGKSWRSQTNPTLLDAELKTKPAFFGALDPEKFLAENEAQLVRETKEAFAPHGSPAPGRFDDPAWDKAPDILIDQYLMAWQGASGTARVLWDERCLYARITVRNAELNRTNSSLHEQDSVEVFIDEQNQKTRSIQNDDGQYRVNFENERSFSRPELEAGFDSAASVSEKSYTVIMQIPFRTITPQAGMRIGFDLQINGASERGLRQSIAVWNDVSGNSFQDTSGYGLLRLEAK